MEKSLRLLPKIKTEIILLKINPFEKRFFWMVKNSR